MTDDRANRNRHVNMRKADTAAGQVFANDINAEQGVVDLQQDQPRFTPVVFVRGSQNLVQLGGMYETFGRQIGAGKATALSGLQPVGSFCDTVDHGRYVDEIE